MDDGAFQRGKFIIATRPWNRDYGEVTVFRYRHEGNTLAFNLESHNILFARCPVFLVEFAVVIPP